MTPSVGLAPGPASEDSNVEATVPAGCAMVGPMDIPAGRFAVVHDPAGAAFAIIKQVENN